MKVHAIQTANVEKVYQAVMMDREKTTDWGNLIVVMRSKKKISNKDSQWFGYRIINVLLGSDNFMFTEEHLNGTLDKFKMQAEAEGKSIPSFTVKDLKAEELEESEGQGYLNPAYVFRVKEGILEVDLRA